MTHLTNNVTYCPHFGYSRRMLYRTTVIQAASGWTERNSHWAYPLHVFGLPMNTRLQAELEEIHTLFHAAGGAGNTFNLLDRYEYKTCALADDVAQDDVTLGTATASQTDFQLIKTYTLGGRTQDRKITRPIDSTVLVEKDSVLQTVTTHYTIETGGIIRFVTPMSGGEVIKAGLEFYVPVAFVSDDVDITIANKSGGSFVGDALIELAEVRE